MSSPYAAGQEWRPLVLGGPSADIPPAPLERLTWRRELAEVTRLPVQLVFMTSDLDPVLGHQIAREGRVLYQDEPDAWPGERLRLWQLYQDSLPFLRSSRRRLRVFAEKVRGGA